MESRRAELGAVAVVVAVVVVVLVVLLLLLLVLVVAVVDDVGDGTQSITFYCCSGLPSARRLTKHQFL